MASPGRRRQRGFTYLWVLFAVALLGVGLTAASEVWVAAARRQQREQFDWVGAQFVRAIGSHYHAGPGGLHSFPKDFADLLEDRRSATPRRHLRSVYPNPFTGRADWELLRGGDGRMRGVRGVMMTSEGPVAHDFAYTPGAAD